MLVKRISVLCKSHGTMYSFYKLCTFEMQKHLLQKSSEGLQAQKFKCGAGTYQKVHDRECFKMTVLKYGSFWH